MDKIEAYYRKEGPYTTGIQVLREIALQTELKETLKWGAPVYTINGKNVLGILAFKNHFCIWFFQGVFLKDTLGVLQNAQEGKTKAMRHWKFKSQEDIEPIKVLEYFNEAIANQKKGLVVKATSKKTVKESPDLITFLASHGEAQEAFKQLSTAKKNEYHSYISEAKQLKTKESRLQKVLPLIIAGKGLNDKYRS
ncbi:YdeI/OmpD-associated family protein [Eudoraea chungangensis]|uniref:YdeI/OmpD-associated family protein n=1 Tax=Eudoraea chungangensis TaxID=1481905 RepID=UPI0023EAC825|nr:DUF1801 domain-containing protein [Eudoraea chungangensis]